MPERVQYASLFGCSFLWSYRSSVFISHPELDFQTHRAKSQVSKLRQIQHDAAYREI